MEHWSAMVTTVTLTLGLLLVSAQVCFGGVLAVGDDSTAANDGVVSAGEDDLHNQSPAISSFGISQYLLTHRTLSSGSTSVCDSHSDCKYLGLVKPRCCGGQCVDSATDEKHCGSCNKKCKQGATCCKGKCTVLSGKDRSNCGGCGTKCNTPGYDCCQGKCLLVAGSSDPLNCGACGRVCRTGFVCCKGHCKNINGHDRSNCGGCGKLCSFGADCCKGACKSVRGSDASNCGGCGKKCKGGVKCQLGICGYNDSS